MLEQPTDPQRRNLVVVGGGFAGLTFIKHCKVRSSSAGPAPEVVLIDRQNHHLFQPLLYQVAMAGLASTEIAAPLRGVLSGRRDVTVLMDEVTSIDPHRKMVVMGDREIAYDYLVLAAGGRTSYFGNDRWEAHAPGLKTINDALRIRRGVLSAFERAEASMHTAEQERLMNIVVVGGGPTGVELAGAMGELVQRVFHRDFRRIDVRAARVILVESNDRLLKTYAEDLSASALRQLESLGVEVRLNTRVADVDAQGVDLNDGSRIETRNVLWGAGVRASELTDSVAADEHRDRGGRIAVLPDLSVPGHPEIFAIGDLARLTDPDGQEVPGVAPAAMQMGKHAAKLIAKELRDGPTPPQHREAFDYWDKGSMATIGRKRAIAQVGRLRLTGLPAWLAWLGVHLMFLVTFRNKVLVMIQWFYAYVAFRRGARIIVPRECGFDESGAKLS
ncbi:MAG: NAD(P)/FAD-dependent oxidoreductase [Planctomycetota bacterium]